MSDPTAKPIYAPVRIVIGQACQGRSLELGKQSCQRGISEKKKNKQRSLVREKIINNIPIQWDRDGAQPGAHAGPQSSAPDCICWSCECVDFFPDGAVDTVDVDERCRGEERHVHCAEDGVRRMGGQWTAEQDEKNCEDGCSQEEGEGQGEESGLVLFVELVVYFLFLL